MKTPTERSLEKRETRTPQNASRPVSLSTSRLSFQEAKTTAGASAPDSRAPHAQAGPVPGTHRPFHERLKRTKRPPRSPRRTAVPRPDGHLSAHKPIPQGHARLPPAPRPTPPRYLSQMESSSQAPWSSVSGEQEERELKDGLLRLAAVAVEGPGCCAQRGHGAASTDEPGPGESRRARPDSAGLGSGQAGAARRRLPRLPGRRPSSSALLSSRARMRRRPDAARPLPRPPSGGGLRTATGTPSWQNSCGPAHTLRPFAEREGALTGTQGPRQARSRGTAASSLGFYSNVRPETTQRLQANPLTSVLAAYVQVPRLTGQWKQNTK